MSDDTFLLDAYDKFASVLNEMMIARGLDSASTGVKEMKKTTYYCTEQFDACYNELMAWIVYGDDRKALTRALLRRSSLYGGGYI